MAICVSKEVFLLCKSKCFMINLSKCFIIKKKLPLS